MPDTITVQSLRLSYEQFSDLLSNKIKHTIRLGEKDIEPGFMMYQGATDSSQTAFVWVKDVYHLKLKGVSVKLGEPLEDLIKTLQHYYPVQTITGDTKVTLIQHLSVDETTKIFPSQH